MAATGQFLSFGKPNTLQTHSLLAFNPTSLFPDPPSDLEKTVITQSVATTIVQPNPSLDSLHELQSNEVCLDHSSNDSGLPLFPSPLTNVSALPAVYSATQKQPFVQMTPYIKLNETCYGEVNRLSPLGLMLFNKQVVVQNVFELPSAFANSVYANGVVGLDTIHALGLSVMCDRGMVYVWNPEHSSYHSKDSHEPIDLHLS
ncbi:hypothetical protein BDV3_006669 [Batrachochytrium dendrobatidis]|uniref:Uncharacterized protein n=1 Tax=Batrachochytrium dendrobatidis (strain JEL423) TaxID=403673 RepID=A0A177WS95_BATDL|nr:hypothetical protein QVD99_007257 [Batrachochytrium dendrobatidis]OAJ42534.1 hypothetical protein, variant [Batrachochytrium dendrobatidis JEL423]